MRKPKTETKLPTKAGFYWCEHFVINSMRPVVLEVFERTLFPGLWYCGPHSLVLVGADDPLKVKWLEHIPSSATLKALRELAAEVPDSENCEGICMYCHAMLRRFDTEPHKPDCPWLRAQESDNAE